MKHLPIFLVATGLSASILLFAVAGSAQETESPTVKAPAGAVLRFDFDAPEKDAMVPDRSGNKNHGAVSAAKQNTAGIRGSAYLFSSANNSIRVPSHPSLHSETITLSAWFRASSPTTSDRHILDNGNIVVGISGVPEDGDVWKKDKVFVAIDKRRLVFSDYVVTDGAWIHVAATYDGSKVLLYLNGRRQKQEATSEEKLAANGSDLLLGSTRIPKDSKDRAVSLNGYLDEVAIYDRALSDDEVRNLALSTDPTVGEPKYTKRQVLGLYSQIKRLYEEGLITDEFLEKKVRQMEAGLGDQLPEAGAK